MRDNYYDSKEFKDDLRKYEHARDEGHSVFLDSDTFTDIAEYYLSQGMLRHASEAVEEALTLFPDATGPLTLKARLLLMRHGDVEQATRIIDQIRDKDDLDYFYINAEIMIADDRPGDADAYLNDLLPQLDEADRVDLVLDSATLFADYNLTDYARLWLEKSHETDDQDYRELRGRILYGEGHYEESEQIFTQLVDEQPFTTFYWNQLAAIQYAQRRFNDSLTSSEYAIAINPHDSDALINKGNCLFSLNNFEESAVYYQRYIDENPDSEIGYLHKGECLLNNDKIDEAISQFLSAEHHSATDSPFLPDICQDIAFAYSRQGKCQQAILYVDKAISHGVQKEEMLVLKGHVYLENGQNEQAAQYFTEAIKTSNSSPDIMIRVGTSLFDNNYVDEAYHILKPLLSSAAPDWNIGYSYLALCAKEMHKDDEYLLFLDKAVKKNPQEARNVLSALFPDDMEPEDYYQYALNQLQQ